MVAKRPRDAPASDRPSLAAWSPHRTGSGLPAARGEPPRPRPPRRGPYASSSPPIRRRIRTRPSSGSSPRRRRPGSRVGSRGRCRAVRRGTGVPRCAIREKGDVRGHPFHRGCQAHDVGRSIRTPGCVREHGPRQQGGTNSPAECHPIYPNLGRKNAHHARVVPRRSLLGWHPY